MMSKILMLSLGLAILVAMGSAFQQPTFHDEVKHDKPGLEQCIPFYLPTYQCALDVFVDKRAVNCEQWVINYHCS